MAYNRRERTGLAERLGAVCFLAGALLLAAYAALFALLLPIRRGVPDFTQLVLHARWKPLAVMAFAGVVLVILGLDAVYARIRETSGVVGAIGLLATKVALIFQACVLTWELLIDPIIAARPGAVFLLKDAVIFNDPDVTTFRWIALVLLLAATTLFGLAVYRSNQFPVLSFFLILVGALMYAAGPMVSLVLSVAGVVTLSAGFVLIGVRLLQPGPHVRKDLTRHSA